MVILGVDLASYQGAPDFDKVKHAGYVFGITKVTEDGNYTFPGFRRNRTEMRRVGMGIGLYHFARAGNATAEADYFLGAVGPVEPGEVLALDWETTSPDPVQWCHTWLSRVYARTGVRPFIYLNQSTVERYPWLDIAKAGFPLWLAQYDGKTNFPGVRYWGQPVIKQYSDAGTVPGIQGKVDLDCLNGDLGMFHRFGANPATAAPPTGPESLPILTYGMRDNPKVASLQKFLNAYPWKPALDVLPVTGNYLDQTRDVVKAAQAQMGVTGNDANGEIVGPRTNRGLWDRGWRG
jgi:GH25 family lysozyme M1 (1,4-beta-N-acetylmuramidase)